MVEIIKRIIMRLFPELAGGYHLPRFAIVTGIPDTPNDGALADNFRPRYAVDVQLLDKHGEVDDSLPPLQGVPVSMATGGEEMGFLSLPSVGTKVVIQFINGMPNWPIITAILADGLSLAPLKPGQDIWKGGLGAEQSVSIDGDWSRSTIGKITDTSDERQVMAYKNNEQYRNTESLILENAKETIGGDKQSVIAGKSTLLASNDMILQTASSLTISAANKLNLVAGAEYNETTNNLRSIKATWLYIGDQTDNLLQIELEHLNATEQIAQALNMQPIANQINRLKLKLVKMLPPKI